MVELGIPCAYVGAVNIYASPACREDRRMSELKMWQLVVTNGYLRQVINKYT